MEKNLAFSPYNLFLATGMDNPAYEDILISYLELKGGNPNACKRELQICAPDYP